MIKIAIITGSTRPDRNGKAIADWAFKIADSRNDAAFELVDIKDYDLPLLDEAKPAIYQDYTQSHTRKWAAKISEFDAFVFVTPEYNHSTSGALKNAIDFLYKEWMNKAAGFVGYGGLGASRAVEHLRGMMAEIHIADVREQVALTFHDYKNGRFQPNSQHENSLHSLIDQLILWGRALQKVRLPKNEKSEYTT